MSKNKRYGRIGKVITAKEIQKEMIINFLETVDMTTISEISEELGISRSSVYILVRELDLYSTGKIAKNIRKNKLSKYSLEMTILNHIKANEGETLLDISKKLGVNQTVIHEIAKKHKLYDLGMLKRNKDKNILQDSIKNGFIENHLMTIVDYRKELEDGVTLERFQSPFSEGYIILPTVVYDFYMNEIFPLKLEGKSLESICLMIRRDVLDLIYEVIFDKETGSMRKYSILQKIIEYIESDKRIEKVVRNTEYESNITEF